MRWCADRQVDEATPDAAARSPPWPATAQAGRELFREQIAERVGGRSRQFVKWVGRYRTGGLDAVVAQPGRAPKLTAAKTAAQAILDGGPRPADKAHYAAATSAGSSKFGVVYTAGGIYDVLRRLDYSSLKPRPRRKNDPVEAARFEQRAPFLRGR